MKPSTSTNPSLLSFLAQTAEGGRYLATAVLIGLIAFVATQSTVPTVSGVDRTSERHCIEAPENNYCAPVDDQRVLAAVKELNATGHSCIDKAVLTDLVIFQHRRSHKVEILTFQEAYDHGAAGNGWSQRFCLPSEQMAAHLEATGRNG